MTSESLERTSPVTFVHRLRHIVWYRVGAHPRSRMRVGDLFGASVVLALLQASVVIGADDSICDSILQTHTHLGTTTFCSTFNANLSFCEEHYVRTLSPCLS